MKQYWIRLFIALLMLSHGLYAQTDSGRLRGITVPIAGDSMHFTYYPAGGPLQQEQHITAMAYAFNDYKWVAVDLPLVQENGHWTGHYLVPAPCAFLAIQFVKTVSGVVTIADNNDDRGFVMTTRDKAGRIMPGADLAWGIFRYPALGKAPTGYFHQFTISKEAWQLWMTKEREHFPQNIHKYFEVYLAALQAKDSAAFPQIAERNLVKYAKEPGTAEDDLITVMNCYRFQLKDTAKADSVHRFILSRYPQGKIARQVRYNDVSAMPLDEKKLVAMEGLLHDFPVNAYRQTHDGTQNFIYYNMYRQLASAYFASQQDDKLRALIPDMDLSTLNEIFRWNIDRIFTLHKLPLERIYPVAHALIDEMIKKRNDLSYMDGTRYTPQQALEVATLQLDNKLSIHIRLLDQMGRYEEAKPYLAYLSEQGKYSDAALNEAHADILAHTGAPAMVLPVLEMGMRYSAATPAMIAALKQDYTEKHGNLDGYDNYVASLKPAADVAALHAALKAKMIHEKITPFQLTGLDGQIVNSNNWQHKIIVIDYWATWCFPCKAAFPGMQLAIDHFAADSTVAFYFIATMERKKSYKEDIQQYLQTSGYRFHVLLDDNNKKTGANDRVFSSMTPLFHSSAIPRKVIIKDGYIRYTAEGYAGSPSGLMEEISTVISILKAENE
ncbi:Thiol-disulfide isomerase or thioredoxin [Chitinophaga costaii]|uniref:Thiol-disulfide isomerase or thioredoxin n=1 Tax=Chitinophaga costaii TaxID=1335309 RepID=A0A1C4ELV0_9BACT|nr:TlpA disulfide reductase family protein [Chitinophaga costaii]PUZ22438.1 TlpA family protein disulfide reductase [Chitinophaga costaii]SCC44625.1 Thiol-disulfide isomerase or thioredoxin [Chitinophaga costaii]